MSTPWRSVAASVPGSDHTRADLPNQDALRTRVTSTGALLVLASDGAGSASLGEVGAALACDTALSLLDAPELVLPTGADELGRIIACAARAALEAESESRAAPLRQLACTLLVALVEPERAFFAQIGDGAMVFATAAAPLEVAFWPDKGEYANETTFLTSPNFESHLESRWVHAPLSSLAVFTDGLERLALDFAARAPFPAFFAPMFGALHGLPDSAEPSLAALTAELTAFLASPRVDAATGDDRSLVLAVR